jgi:hypothetical protein
MMDQAVSMPRFHLWGFRVPFSPAPRMMMELGFPPRGEPREPTCWALRRSQMLSAVPQEWLAGRSFHARWQTALGLLARRTKGSYHSLACGVLSDTTDSSASVATTQVVCGDYPRDSSLWRPIIGRFSFWPQSPRMTTRRGWLAPRLIG